MLGLPNQTLLDLEETLEDVLNLNPEHISTYSLIVEQNTKLEELIDSGELTLPDECLERAMYWKVKRTLEDKGYRHYEISNFAKKGYESKHNLNCWDQKEYMGFGAAAHSYIDNIRFSNNIDIEKYIENYKLGKQDNNFILQEKQDKQSKMKEYAILSLRKINGINTRNFKARFDENIIETFKEEIKKLANQGLIKIENDNIILTDKGLDFANLVWEEFV